MQCCVCKATEAKVHLTLVMGDKVRKVELCEECARQTGVNDPTGTLDLAGLLAHDGGDR